MTDHLPRSKRIVFATIAALMVVAVIEFVMQTFYYASVGDFLFRRAAPPIYVEDPIRCYRIKGDLEYLHRTNEFEIQVFTDSNGFRADANHREVPVSKSADTYRILVTGPSFAFGWGANYDEIFPTLIERGLIAAGKQVEVLNIGTPGQGPGNQLCWLEKIGYRYQPDMVLHVAYGRQVEQTAVSCPKDRQCPIVEDGFLYPHSPSLWKRVSSFAKRFAIVFYGYYAYHHLFQPVDLPDESKSLHDTASTDSTAQQRQDVRSIVTSYLGYAEFVRSVVGPDTDVTFLYIPFSYLVHPEDVNRFTDVRLEDVELGRERVASTIEALRQEGVAILDTLPALISKAHTERLYYWLDIHFTPAGNKVVAEAAIPFLETQIEAEDATHERSPTG